MSYKYFMHANPYHDKNGRFTFSPYKKYIDIKDGSTVYRATQTDSKEFMNRDYSYFNITDKYYRHAEAVGSGFDGRFTGDFELKTTKKLKIATVDTYFYAMCKVLNTNPNKYIEDIPDSVINKGTEAISEGKVPNKFYEGEGGKYKIFNKVAKELKKEGYDGFIDPIDGRVSLKEYSYKEILPAVIFNPKDNLEITKRYEF